jgi:hypothetical protein
MHVCTNLEVLRSNLSDEFERLSLDPLLLLLGRGEDVRVGGGDGLSILSLVEVDRSNGSDSRVGRDGEREIVAELGGGVDECLGLLAVEGSEHAHDLRAILGAQRSKLLGGADLGVSGLGLLAEVLHDLLVSATTLKKMEEEGMKSTQQQKKRWSAGIPELAAATATVPVFIGLS